MYQRRQWHPTPVLLPGKSHGRRSLVGCGPWGRWESDTTEQLHFYFSLSWIGEGNGNPLQCFCLENPRDGGAWWAAVYGVAQSWTRLKWLSSSSSKQGEQTPHAQRPKPTNGFLGSIFFSFFLFFTLQYSTGFAIHQHESAMGVHKFPLLNPPSHLPPHTIPLGYPLGSIFKGNIWVMVAVCGLASIGWRWGDRLMFQDS